MSDVDHVVLAGDIVDNSELDYFKELVDDLKENLKDFQSPYQELVTIVPGNHDIFPGSHGKLIHILSPENANDNFERFKRIARPFNSNYPAIKTVDRVVIVQCDTTADTRWKHARGNFDEEQADELLTDLAEYGPIRILVMHHYPFKHKPDWPLRLTDTNFTEESLRTVRMLMKEGQFSLVLCGHLHVTNDRTHANTKVYSPGSSDDYDDDGYDLFYWVHNISSDGQITSHWEEKDSSEYAQGEYFEPSLRRGYWDECVCGYPVKQFWYCCPDCGEGLEWGDDQKKTGCECGYCGWVVADKFRYCPWCGEDIEDGGSSERSPRRVTGFTLDTPCDNKECDGNVMYPMDYCPWCGEEQEWPDGGRFDSSCDECERGMDYVMYYCPWCGTRNGGT